MNKKEKAELEFARAKLAEAMALHWPIEPKPEALDIPEEREKLSYRPGQLWIGWAYHAWGLEFRVTQGCNNGVNHSYDYTNRTTSQGTGRFYHTKREALLAARWDLCHAFAKTLALLDAELNAEAL